VFVGEGASFGGPTFVEKILDLPDKISEFGFGVRDRPGVTI
jgi:hypothetical protein